MHSTDHLIIGGGLAGIRAAQEIRKRDSSCSITIICNEPYVPYNRPPLSKAFLRGEKNQDEVFVEPESFYKDASINLVLEKDVTGLDAEAKRVILDNKETMKFGKALIATGGEPVRLQLPGTDLEGVHYLRTLDDSKAIAAEVSPERRAVVIGGGFIGIEIAASLASLGVDVTVIETQPYIWSHFVDEKLAGFFQQYCEEKGITFATSTQVTEIRGFDRVISAVTKRGREISCDFVCIGVGVRPRVDIAERAGLKVDNGIVVNKELQTSHPDIYAAGDIANFPDPYFDKRRRVEHWGQADYTGTLAGKNMAGAGEHYDLLTYVFSDIFDLHLEFSGDESEYDETLIRGRFEDKSFTVLYLKKNVMTAYFAINTPDEEYEPFNTLIQEKQDLGDVKDKLTDTDFDVSGLV